MLRQNRYKTEDFYKRMDELDLIHDEITVPSIHQMVIALELDQVKNYRTLIPFILNVIGNIPDVKTVQNLLSDLSILGFEKVKLVMNRGFYSEANINGLMKAHLKFLIAAKASLSLVKKELDMVYDELATFTNLNEQYDLYAKTVMTDWDYQQECPYKGDSIKEKRRVYIHLYYNLDKTAEGQKNFDRKLVMYR